MSERIYTEEEVAAIYARAAERQRLAIRHDSSPGLTLSEIEQAGREAGLDPVSIRAAAAELDTRQRYAARSNVAVAERWIEGPITSGTWEDLVTSLRHQFGSTPAWLGGDVATLGDAQEWTHTSASGARTTVTFSPREGKTLLRVMREFAGLENDHTMGWLMAAFFAVILSLLAGTLVATTLAPDALVTVALSVLVLLSGVAFGGPRFTARVRNKRALQAGHVQQIADDLVERIGVGRSEPATLVSDSAPAPLLDPSLLDTPPAEAEVSPEKQRVRS